MDRILFRCSLLTIHYSVAYMARTYPWFTCVCCNQIIVCMRAKCYAQLCWCVVLFISLVQTKTDWVSELVCVNAEERKNMGHKQVFVDAASSTRVQLTTRTISCMSVWMVYLYVYGVRTHTHTFYMACVRVRVCMLYTNFVCIPFSLPFQFFFSLLFVVWFAEFRFYFDIECHFIKIFWH